MKSPNCAMPLLGAVQPCLSYGMHARSNVCTRRLAGKRLVALDVTSLVAGSAYRGEFEGRLRGLLKDVADARGSVILFIDEMHMLSECLQMRSSLLTVRLAHSA